MMGVGKLMGKTRGRAVWHLREDGKTYWCGLWHDRTPRQLFKECQTILLDLARNHPDLIKE